MISKITIKTTGNETIEKFYEYLVELFHTGQEQLAFAYLFKANKQQLFDFLLYLTEIEDIEAIAFFIANLKQQKWG